MLWVKSFHIIFMVTWFAGLFYLPRLFVYHAMSDDANTNERFKVMEKKLLYIMTLGGVAALALGLWLWLGYGFHGGWLHLKVALTSLLVIYHAHCAKLVQDFKHDRNRHGHVFYRWYNEFPGLILIADVILVVVKPF